MRTRLRELLFLGLQQFSTKTISDKYLTWLGYANAGMLHKGNPYPMKYAIENLPSTNPILEIGSFCGLSINVINYLLQTNNKTNKVFSCDRWVFDGNEVDGKIGNGHISYQQYGEFAKSSFIRNVEFFSSHRKPYTIESFSDEFFTLWEKAETVNDVFGRSVRLGGKFSFCYIDGNHTYPFAKRDFENADRFLETGGYILFDDSSDVDPYGLTQLMKEIKQKKTYQLIMKNPNYLFKKIA